MQNNNQDKTHHKTQAKEKNPQLLVLTEVNDQEAEIVTGGSSGDITSNEKELTNLGNTWTLMTWDND